MFYTNNYIYSLMLLIVVIRIYAANTSLNVNDTDRSIRRQFGPQCFSNIKLNLPNAFIVHDHLRMRYIQRSNNPLVNGTDRSPSDRIDICCRGQRHIRLRNYHPRHFCIFISAYWILSFHDDILFPFALSVDQASSFPHKKHEPVIIKHHDDLVYR